MYCRWMKALSIAALTLGAQTASAAGSRWLAQTGEGFLEGEFEGVVLDASGQLVAAPVHREIWTMPDYYVWDLALDPSGRLVAATGDSGTLYQQDDDGLKPWSETLALEILCLLPWEDGVLAGSSPDGIVFRVHRDGRHEVALDIPQQSIWDLAAGSEAQSWLAAAGPVARVVRVSREASAGEELYSFPATNATALVRDASTLWIGTQGPGLVYRVDGDDGEPARLVFEAAEDEIRSIVSDGHGGAFVLSVGSTPSTDATEAASSRITWLPASGGWETVRAAEERWLSLARLGDGALLVGEASSGRLLRVTIEGQQSLWAQLDESDPLDILLDGDTCYVGTGNLGAVHRLDRGEGEGGVYTSVELEAKHLERWGRFMADGRPQGVEFSTRTGVRKTVDDTWSEWSDYRQIGETIESPVAPFLEFRLRIPTGASVTGVRIAYAERNLPPQIASVEVAAGGGDFTLGGVNGSPPPVSQRFDDGLGVEYTVQQSRPRAQPEVAAWARGLRTVRWTATDPNDDALRYHVEVRTLDGGDWLRVATDLDQGLYAWDTRSFEDGSYQVRVTAHDTADNPSAQSRSTTALSAPVHVDNTPPRVARLRWSDTDAQQIEADVEDASSALAEVAARADDGTWMPLSPQDGVLDGPAEHFRFAAPDPARPGGGDRVWLRAVDAAGNVSLKELARRR